MHTQISKDENGKLSAVDKMAKFALCIALKITIKFDNTRGGGAGSHNSAQGHSPFLFRCVFATIAKEIHKI